MNELWDLWFPNAGATGLSFARTKVTPSGRPLRARIVDPAELLAACLHRQRFPGHLARCREAVRRGDAKLEVHDSDR